MLQFGLLGLGQFGSNIGEYALTKGFKVVIANTAKVDLMKNAYIKEENKIYLGGKGAGRNRKIGMEATIDNAEKILDTCKREFQDCDVVFVAASGGGGTGSGGLPIGLEILMNDFEYVCAIIGLPENDESPKSKMNTLECFEQLSSIENLGSVFIVDNQKAKNINPIMPRNRIYEVTNQQLIDYLCEINSLTDKPSYVSNFDASDFISILQERGYTLLSKTENMLLPDDNKFKVAKLIRDSWINNYQSQFTNGQIVKAAILSKISPAISNVVDINVIFQEIGIPYDYNDIYFSQDEHTKSKEEKSFTCYSILSGLSFPNERLSELNESIKVVEEKLINNMNNSHSQTFTSDNWTSKFKKEKKQNSDNKTNLLERMKKYVLK